MAIFHYTVKIVGRSKGKSVISASAYLNGDVMKNKETGRISYYTSKKEVVYTSLMMCENAPPEWQIVPEENIKRFQKSVRYKKSADKEAALEKFKITFQKQRLWNEVLKIEKNADAQLGRSFEFALPKEWNRQEQIQYTTDYIQKTFVDRGMCADWSIHDKGDGNPHVHLLLTMRPFNPDHSWGKKEVKDQLIVELKTQLNESLTLNEKLNKENRAGNIQALKNDLKLADRALRSEKEKLRSANVTIGECQDKIRCLTQQRDYARTHQKIVEIPVEKPVLYEKCEACDRTAYQNEKAKYETQKERLAGQYKAKTVMFQTTLFLLAWYSLTTTLFQAVQSDVFLSDCKSFFHDAASFIQTFIGWTIEVGQSVAQISTKIPNPFIAGMVYWILLILIVGICVAGTGILAILIEIKVIELYREKCWDVITLLMILTSAAVIIYFGEAIKKALSVNLLLLFVLLQGAYVGLRCYLESYLEKRNY